MSSTQAGEPSRMPVLGGGRASDRRVCCCLARQVRAIMAKFVLVASRATMRLRAFQLGLGPGRGRSPPSSAAAGRGALGAVRASASARRRMADRQAPPPSERPPSGRTGMLTDLGGTRAASACWKGGFCREAASFLRASKSGSRGPAGRCAPLQRPPRALVEGPWLCAGWSSVSSSGWGCVVIAAWAVPWTSPMCSSWFLKRGRRSSIVGRGR